MKGRYVQLTNSAGFQEGDSVWQYRHIQKRGKSPKLQVCWEGPNIIITWINIIYCIQWHHRAKMMVIQLDGLAPYLGVSQDE
jgi:hypothetical protein